MIQRPDTAAARDNLKDFQLRTVDYVFSRLYGSDSTRRFLVADEVGLGKTLIARGVIARAIDHLWNQRIKHIEIIYICSNADIARQNVRRLLIPGCATEEMRATRLSPSFSTGGVSDPGRGSKWTSCLKGLHYKSDLSVLV